MMITHQPRHRFATTLLTFSLTIFGVTILSLTLVPRASAQDSVAPSNLASANAGLDSPVQVSPQQLDAVVPPQHGPKLLSNYTEAGGNYLALSNGFGFWRGGYARSVFTKGNNIWNAEVNGQQEFGDSGVYVAAGDSYNFNPDWYGSLTVGSSVGGFFWPRFRADGFLNKKWLRRRQLITTFGFSYYAAKDPHRDHSFYAGSTYYFQRPWILEEGIRFNISNPGSVFSPAAFVAVTQGRNKQHYLTVRTGFGKEAYQLIGPTVNLTDFRSQTFTLTWRQWLGTSWGFNLVGDYYHSPFYVRGGTSFGFFKEF
jgi:YaiO family outer membrane protein